MKIILKIKTKIREFQKINVLNIFNISYTYVYVEIFFV